MCGSDQKAEDIGLADLPVSRASVTTNSSNFSWLGDARKAGSRRIRSSCFLISGGVGMSSLSDVVRLASLKPANWYFPPLRTSGV